MTVAERKWTPEQRLAIDTRDRTLLVSAAAGSGKTATLTERIISSILDEENPRDIGSMLIVTFTNAAVGELRERISAAIKDAALKNPDDSRLEEQLLTVKDARIMTIDAFCNEILRGSASEVGLSPNYRIADTAEAELLAKSIIDGLINSSYEGELSELYSAEEFATLADCLTTTRASAELSEVFRMVYDSLECAEAGVEALLPLIEEYNPEGFTTVFSTRIGTYIKGRILSAVSAYLKIYERYLPPLASGTPKEQKGFSVFSGDEAQLRLIAGSGDYAALRASVLGFIFSSLPGGKGEKGEEYDTLATARGYLKDDIKKFAESFLSYTEDEWRTLYRGLYSKLTTLYKFIRKFDTVYKAEKLAMSMCEYSDLERYAYSALYNADGTLTPLATELAGKFSEIYIDEYQDVNNLQNKIFEAVSRPDNRFMVGDIKQSIYGFRSANPDIFAKMKGSFPRLGEAGDFPAASLFMSSNFRCDEPIIDFVNGIFDTVFGMLGESIGYDEGDRLKFAKLYPDGSTPAYAVPEIHLIEKAEAMAGSAEEIAALAEEEALTSASEAECVARKISELISNEKKADGSPILPSDIAIIMRSTRSRGKEYSDALKTYGIKSSVLDSRDMLLSEEVLLTLSLLNSIDNPHRDIYLASLMCSPLFDFSADELVKIHKSSDAPSLWEALNSYTGMHPDYEKGHAFIATLAKYKRMAEGTAVSALLSTLYRETGLLALASRYGGKDNLILLHGYARSFERSSTGLYSFIRYLNSMLEEHKTFEKQASGEGEDSVRIITAHKSKGLEYPVCFFVGTATRIAKSEVARISYAEDFALAMLEKDPGGIAIAANPVFSAVCDYKAMREYEEELRVLYVVLTRARERLYIYGTCPKKNCDEYLASVDIKRELLCPYTARKLSSMLEIILVCRGTGILITESCAITAKNPTEQEQSATEDSECTDNDLSSEGDIGKDELIERFTYEYPHPELLAIPEKLSVSRLYPDILDGAQDSAVSLDELQAKIKDTAQTAHADCNGEETKDTEARTGGNEGLEQASVSHRAYLPRFAALNAADESAKRGIATHTVLQFCDFERLEALGTEAELTRLKEQKFISEADAARVRIDEIDKFTKTPLFAQIRAAKRLYRELRFNLKLPASDFTADKERKALLSDREILVQGVIDCVIENADGSLTLIDYKTDRLTARELKNPEEGMRRLANAHRLQLSYYEKAVSLMFGRAPMRVGIYSLHLGCEIDTRI